MNFNQFYFGTKELPTVWGFPEGSNRQAMEFAWNACKEEALKIVFLNTKQNGKKSIDVDLLVKEIEKL